LERSSKAESDGNTKKCPLSAAAMQQGKFGGTKVETRSEFFPQKGNDKKTTGEETVADRTGAG